MGSHRVWFLSTALLLAACAGNRHQGPSPFFLVKGKKIGVLEVVPENGGGWTRKSRDSLEFDNQHLRTKPRIGFKYPGKAITLMKVYDGEKLVKTCDEGSYSRHSTPVILRDPTYVKPTAPGAMDANESYSSEYNLVCDVPVFKDGMRVELHDAEGLVSMYKVVTADP